jgi:hypothetical protein
MQRFSRWMPPAAASVAWEPRAKAAVVVLAAAAILAIALWPSARIASAIFFAVLVAAWWLSDRRLRQVAVTRQGEDIGSFAKMFDRRRPDFDPWVVRAVWDALQPYRTFRGGVAPLRPSDRLASFMDVDDLDDIVFPEVAERTGRTLANVVLNPKYAQVHTVADLVASFWQQPRGEQPNAPLQPSSGAPTTN